MGAGMARALRRGGHEVVVWNRTRAKAEPLADDGISVAESVGEAVQGADVVMTMLFDADATLSVREELMAALGDDAVWLQAGTVGPDSQRQIAEGAKGRMLDAPVVGTKKPAEEGKLVALVSGPAALVDNARLVLDAISAKTIVVGDEIGSASSLKLVCNAWIAVLTTGTAQSIGFAERLGVDPALFLQVIGGGPADSPYAQLKGQAMVEGEYATSFAVDGLAKDLALMEDAARRAHFPDELFAAVRDLFERASAEGHGKEDIAAVRFVFNDPEIGRGAG
jgi:3-hydroxyisobutyrate dehydrogenase